MKSRTEKTKTKIAAFIFSIKLLTTIIENKNGI